MKIHEILTETEDYDDHGIAALLQKDCAPFLAAINNNIQAHSMWRGMNIPATNIARFTTRKNRKPVDMPQEVSTAVDNYFEETTGVRWRAESVFVTGNQSAASEYGNLFCMFPIGQFHYCWSPRVTDLYTTLDRYLDRYKLRYYHFSDYPSLEAEEQNKRAFSTLRTLIMPTLAYQVDTDLTDAIAMGTEIMVTCDKYYMVSSKIINAVADVIRYPIR